MKNKNSLKKTFIIIGIIVFIFLNLFAIILYKQYNIYTKNYNKKINSILGIIIEKYPNIEKNDLISILNTENESKYEILKEYGINIEKDSAILENDKEFVCFFIINIILFIIAITTVITIFIFYNYNKNKKIKEITNYIEELNKKNYKLHIEDNSEDELSILKNELYKITVMLKETAENSIKDKMDLKNSLSDISHQLKTPITSILIMLDNILDNKDMPENVRNEFIQDIKREIINIKFLVESILKLSKLDSNSVNFIKKKVMIEEIISESEKNVSIISELKNIKMNIEGDKTNEIICDLKWQVEAITNILKNCIEHSEKNGMIDVKYEQNSLYTKIEIQDYGCGIEKSDLPHIFERFYKGKNSSSESIRNRISIIKINNRKQ